MRQRSHWFRSSSSLVSVQSISFRVQALGVKRGQARQGHSRCLGFRLQEGLGQIDWDITGSPSRVQTLVSLSGFRPDRDIQGVQGLGRVRLDRLGHHGSPSRVQALGFRRVQARSGLCRQPQQGLGSCTIICGLSSNSKSHFTFLFKRILLKHSMPYASDDVHNVFFLYFKYLHRL